MSGRVVELRDRGTIERLLRRDAAMNAYLLGDLDDRIFPHTRYYAVGDAVALLYTAAETPVLLCFARRSGDAVELVRGLEELVPGRFYAHVASGIWDVFQGTFAVEPRGLHLKMQLVKPVAPPKVATRPLAAKDLPEIMALYEVAYPATWFEPRCLETDLYVGAFDGTKLVAIAGTHVVSDRLKVAALGNIAVHPEARGKGLGGAVTAGLIRILAKREILLVGLNVKADNAAAIKCYERLGFARAGDYEEALARVR